MTVTLLTIAELLLLLTTADCNSAAAAATNTANTATGTAAAAAAAAADAHSSSTGEGDWRSNQVLTPEVHLASVFHGNTPVLQRGGHGLAIWGNATKPVSRVEISLDGRALATATVNALTGKWIAHLPPQHKVSWQSILRVDGTTTNTGSGVDGSSNSITKSPATTTTTTTTTTTIPTAGVAAVAASANVIIASTSSIVRIGETILCSGQSNMQMPVSNYKVGGFSASNGTAEIAAAGRYTDRISLMTLQTPFPEPTMPPWNGSRACLSDSPPDCTPAPEWNAVSPGPNGTLHGFSAVCWYTGKALYERLGETVPVGLMVGSVGGSPIEFWLSQEALSTCPADTPPCDTNHNKTDTEFYNQFIKPLQPYTLGSVVWDQGERDVHCFAPATNRTAAYPCLERALVRSWRAAFNSSFAFVAVQLPGYIGDCDAVGANPLSSYRNCVPGVFDMRLAQDTGVTGEDMASVVATYDLSCPYGVRTPQCPFGSVHNVNKTIVCQRAALQLLRMRGLLPTGVVTEGPRAIRAVAKIADFRKPPAAAASVASSSSSSFSSINSFSSSSSSSSSQEYVVEATAAAAATSYTIEVTFAGGSSPFYQRGTQYCVACCQPGTAGDFDVSADGGLTYVNATLPAIIGTSASISVAGLRAFPTHVRYTANQGFPQCAIYNRQGLPALPFTMEVEEKMASPLAMTKTAATTLVKAAVPSTSSSPVVAQSPRARVYSLHVVSHARLPVLSSANARGQGHSDCLVFNPSIVVARPPFSNRSGLLVRECCGSSCTGHGDFNSDDPNPNPNPNPNSTGHGDFNSDDSTTATTTKTTTKTNALPAERISFADCDLATGTCQDPDPTFNLDPSGDTEDPRGLWADADDGYYYLFYYHSPNTDVRCHGAQCTVPLARTKTPTVAASYEHVRTLPWHRNGCCIVRPAGQRTVCMWGEGPGPFPGLGVSVSLDGLRSGNFTQVPWQLGDSISNASSPLTSDDMWLLPLGSSRQEVKLEAGTHIHPLSTGDLLTFYAAATPGWVPNGNYTVGWLVLDGTDPTRIVARSTKHILIPTWDYETLCGGASGCTYKGERKNVIFACSAMPTGRKTDEFRLYFGGGDGNVGTAVIQVNVSTITSLK